MKISLSILLGNGAGKSFIDVYVDQVSRAHKEGFSRVWTPQLPWEPDLSSTVAVALREVPDIEIGASVLPIQVAHPMLTAQRALTLSRLSDNRFSLGLGVNHPKMSEKLWGVPWEKPVRRMREYLDGLLPLLAGDTADSTGELVTTRGSLDIPHAATPPVYIAALGPQMLRLAGGRAAGTLTWMTGPKTLAGHIGPTLRDAASAAGRSAHDVKVVAVLPVCVTDDAKAVKESAAKQFEIYGTLPSYRAMLDREGYANPEDSALIGDESSVSSRIEELRAAGVDEFVGQPMGEDDETLTRTRTLLRSLDDE
ncbi:LLM class F420-dependent oxidoreductase [Mycobacterium paraffinicum]|uniref:LLM class F420-dependent oxidoreductase n=1 Tax=Mycobacterium paraffinicum TaxID=53378 RepID=A0A1Q4HYP5_9MYCO|nr:LLM class F420-dependent oxidoreductase [Mycobacterium paraffinicum]